MRGNARLAMAKPIVSISRRPQSVLVTVCAKCDGDGRALRRAMKRDLEGREHRAAVRVVATSCLDLCPKRAVAIAIARDAEPTAYYVVDERTAHVRDVVDLIG